MRTPSRSAIRDAVVHPAMPPEADGMPRLPRRPSPAHLPHQTGSVEREREIVLGKTRHTQFVSYTSRRRVVPRVDPHARVRSSMVVAPVRLPPRTRVTTLHTSLNRRIQSTEPSGATSSPSALGRARRILEDAIRARGVVCVIFVVRSPAPRLPRGSLVAPGRERRGRRM